MSTLPLDVPPALGGLLAACKAAPEDPTPRLVLADWLTDHDRGDLGECVRLSCEAERLPEYDERADLIRAVVNDPNRPAGMWLSRLREGLPGVSFHGGLLRVMATPAELIALDPERAIPAPYRPWMETLRLRSIYDGPGLYALAQAGWLRPFTSLDLDQTAVTGAILAALVRPLTPDGPGGLDHLAKLTSKHGHLGLDAIQALTADPERLPALRSLSLHNNRPIGDSGVAALARSPLLSRLTDLDAYHVEMGPEGAEALAKSRGLASLVSLDVGLNRFGAEGLRAFLESPHLAGLRSLGLSALNAKPEDFAQLLRWPKGRGLRHLDLSSQTEGGACARVLAGSALLESLESLEFSGSNLGTKALRGLLAALPPGRLRRLSFKWSDIGNDAARALAESPALSGLTELDLLSTDMGPEGVQALAASPHLRNLEWLRLSYNKIGRDGCRALAGVGARGKTLPAPLDDPFPRLRYLLLDKANPTRAGVDALLASPLVSRLELLDLSGCRLQAGGATALANCPRLTGLRFLNLATCSLGDEGVKVLANSPHLGNLVGLNLMQNRITDEGVRGLATSTGLGRLTWLRLTLNKLTEAGVETLLARWPGPWAFLGAGHDRLSRSVADRLAAASVLSW